MPYLIRELSEETGYSPRAIRLFAQRGVIARPKLGGPRTMYDEEHRLRLLAMRAMRKRRVPFQTIRATLNRASPEELLDLAGARPAPTPEPPTAVPSQAAAAWGPVAERCLRVALAPGLELLVRDGAAPEVLALALAIRDMCGSPRART